VRLEKRFFRDDYCTVIERYLLPFFGNRYFDRIDHRAVAEFEQWRNERIGHAPARSTLLTYAAAWNRIQQTALERGWLTAAAVVPKLPVRGRPSQARPGFTADEVVQLRSYMASWCTAPRRVAQQTEMRLLLRDYVELLLMTGMRHGTEAMRVEWQHWEWHTDKAGNRFLRLRVSGKTGARWLIAKHKAVDVLRRLHARQKDICDLSFETTLTTRVPYLLFRFSDGHQPHSLVGTFRKLMRDSGLLLDSAGQTRTLYSLRHTYATLALLDGGADIHTLSKQMGNSAAMIERHYSKLTATMAADRLA